LTTTSAGVNVPFVNPGRNPREKLRLSRRGRLRAGAVVVVALAGLVASPAVGQDSAKSPCGVPKFRGATSPGGATIAITVRNTGRSCRIEIVSDVEARIATTDIRAVEEPQHGKLEFPSSNVAAYKPNKGYTGPDAFAFAGRGPTRGGAAVEVRVNVKVTVVAP